MADNLSKQHGGAADGAASVSSGPEALANVPALTVKTKADCHTVWKHGFNSTTVFSSWSRLGWWTHPHFVRLVEYGSAIPPRGAGEVPCHYAGNDCVHVSHHIHGGGVDRAWSGVQ